MMKWSSPKCEDINDGCAASWATSPSCSQQPLGWKVTRNQSWVSPYLGPGLELYGNPQSCSSRGAGCREHWGRGSHRRCYSRVISDQEKPPRACSRPGAGLAQPSQAEQAGAALQGACGVDTGDVCGIPARREHACRAPDAAWGKGAKAAFPAAQRHAGSHTLCHRPNALPSGNSTGPSVAWEAAAQGWDNPPPSAKGSVCWFCYKPLPGDRALAPPSPGCRGQGICNAALG